MKDALGDRIKGQYENRTRYYLPRRAYTIIRVDGRAFHTYTRGLARPFDHDFMEDMNATAAALCTEIQGAVFAFLQSDEVSILVTDFGQDDTEAWFDGNLQKMVSIAASTATAAFNACRAERGLNSRATFDGRAFTIPDPTEVENYFVWRQQDATRNSIAMAAQARFSQKQLQGVSCEQMQEMLFGEGINWNDYPVGCKRGRAVVRETRIEDVTYINKRTGGVSVAEGVARSAWVVAEPPVFTQDRDWLRSRIPQHR